MAAICEKRSYQKEESKAFGLEQERHYSHAEIYKDIVSYLGEYRFKLPKYNYQLMYSGGELQGMLDEEPMAVKAQRAIEKNLKLGRPVRREMAELKGFRSLEDQLSVACEGDQIFWVSPPGHKEEGYGNYGFIFSGRVESDKTISMTAIRVEEPTLEKFNQAMLILTGCNFNYKTAEQYLENPVVLSEEINTHFTDEVLSEHFGFKPSKSEQERFIALTLRMRPMINDLIEVIQTKSTQEKIKAFYTLENYFIEIERESRNQTEVIIYSNKDRTLRDMIPDYSYQPPVVAGSCGATGENNFLSSYSFEALMKAIFGEKTEWFKCPKCQYQADGPVGDSCPKCGLTKEDYAKEGHEVC